MSAFEIILALIITFFSILLGIISISALQLIKELKTSIRKLNHLLDHPETVGSHHLQNLADTLDFPRSTGPSGSRRLFHRQPSK